MEARKLAGQMAALCPFALFVGMGFTARKAPEPHYTLQYSQAQNERLEAYLPLMSGEDPLFASPATIRKDAAIWLRFSKRSNLQPLTPAFQEEELMDTPRSAVLERWSGLVLGLSKLARHDLTAGRTDVGTEEATQLLELCSILKYSDFASLRLATAAEGRLVEMVHPVLPKVSAQSRAMFEASVKKATEGDGRVNQLYAILRGNYEAYKVRMNEAALSNTSATDSDLDDNTPSEDRIRDNYAWALRDQAKLVRSERQVLNANS